MNWLLPVVYWLERYWIVVMVLLFVGIVVRTYWPSRRKEMEQQGRIPLGDDN